MAEVKLFKFSDADGFTKEHNSATDDVVFNSFTAGAGPVVSPTGIDMNNTDLSEVQDIDFQDPSTSTIEQTAGALIIDNIMAKERSNSLTTAADILFPAISDTSGQVDALRIPDLASAPTASPTATGEGFIVHSGGAVYVWDGSQWVSQKDNSSTQVDIPYVADTAIAARDVVYISSAGRVSPADADALASASAIGFAVASAAASVALNVRALGVMSGFSSLTPGARYFLSATAGSITATPPTGNRAVIQVGFAKSATELHIQINPIVLRV